MTPGGAGRLGLFLGAYRADGGGAERLRPLTENQPHAAGRRMDEDDVPGFDLVGPVQEIMGRHALHQQRRHLAVVEPVGQVQELVGRIVAHFRVAAERWNTVGDPVACREITDAVADSFDDADPLETDDHRTGRHWPGMGNAAAMVGIGEINPDRRMPQTHFPRRRIGNRPFLPLHGTGRAQFVNDLCFRHLSLPSIAPRRRDVRRPG